MEIYTIQQCYQEAKTLLEKYNAITEGYELSIRFNIDERNDGPSISIAIRYTKSTPSFEYIALGYAPSPYTALSVFEEDLKKYTGKKLIERLGTEVKQTLSEKHKDTFSKKYGKPSSFNPSIADTSYCKYQVNFLDGSNIICVMTNKQRDSILRTSFSKDIKDIGGLGYQLPK